MTEIYRKDRPTDIVMYRGNYSQLKNIFFAPDLTYIIQRVIMPNFSSIGQEMAEILRIQRTCGCGWWVGGGWWIPSKNLVTSDRLVRVSRSRSESVTICKISALFIEMAEIQAREFRDSAALQRTLQCHSLHSRLVLFYLETDHISALSIQKWLRYRLEFLEIFRAVLNTSLLQSRAIVLTIDLVLSGSQCNLLTKPSKCILEHEILDLDPQRYKDAESRSSGLRNWWNILGAQDYFFAVF